MSIPFRETTLVTIKRGYEKEVTEDLILRVAENEDEGKKLAVFNALVHGEELEDYILRLFNQHPDREKILWFYIAEKETGMILSSLALLPMKWKMRDTEINVAELGFVGTRKENRGQGLFGILNDYYELAIKEHGYVLSVLVGIPNYYRKFGYIFALDRYAGYAIPTNNIPLDEIEEVKIRKATEDDLETIETFYNQFNGKYVVSTAFDEPKFNFRLMNTTADIFNSITYIVEQARKPQAFFCIGSLSDENQADIILSSELTYQQMLKVLQFVKNYNMGNINSFKVNVHPSSNFAQFLQSRGADLTETWTWQVKIPDILQFFHTITPVLEDRIANSMFAGLNRIVKFSNYADTIEMNFVDGKIETIDVVKEFPESTVDLRIPDPYYIRLFFSDRSVDDIKYIVTDTLVKKESKLLIDTLFPTSPSIPFSYYE